MRKIQFQILPFVCGSLMATLLFAISAFPQPSAPPNDNFANAAQISGSSGFLGGTNEFATLEPSEPNSCTGCKTVWYRWSAPANLSMTFELVMPSVPPGSYLNDTVMGVYMGDAVNSLQMLTWNDDISAERGNQRSRVTFMAGVGQTYYIRVYGGGGSEGGFFLDWNINAAESYKQFNFDGCSSFEPRKSDFGIFRPLDGNWWVESQFAAFSNVAWGKIGDLAMPADYFGDGCTDVAVWRQETGEFWIADNPTGETRVVRWGMNGDIPVRGDFDGDDKADLAIYRPSTATFWILNSSDGSVRVQKWFANQPIDNPACADYDGDGKTDLAVHYKGYGPAGFAILRSSDGGYSLTWFGFITDRPYQGDFDHDGRADMAIFRGQTNEFFIHHSSDNTWSVIQWGAAGDIRVSGDYIGEAGSDVCVWRQTDATFYCLDPITSETAAFQWGLLGDVPLGMLHQ